MEHGRTEGLGERSSAWVGARRGVWCAAAALGLIVPAASAEGDGRVLVESEARTRTVRCDKGQSLAEVVSRALSGDVVVVKGECSGRIEIATDGITLEGNGAAVLRGSAGDPPAEFSALITVTGASNVVISGLTVQGGSGEGILVQRAGAAVVRNTVVQDNLGTGIAVADGSTVQLIDTVSRRNALGLDVFTGSSAVLKGAVTFSENLGTGVEVNGQSILEIRGADVEACDNGGFGIGAGSSQIVFFGFEETHVPGSKLTVCRNSMGLVMPDSSFEVLGGQFFGSGANVVTVRDNAGAGIWCPQGCSIASPFATARFVISGNEIGIELGQGSVATLVGGLEVSGNDVGLSIDASQLTLVSVPPNPSSVTGNGVDVGASFGARLTIDGAEIGSALECDSSVLSRGSVTCP
jgi:hypothetical protein